jgi:hypothetical protein
MSTGEPGATEIGQAGFGGGPTEKALPSRDLAGGLPDVTATFSAANLEPITRTAKVRVAESVDLAAGKHVSVTASPGAEFSAPLARRRRTRFVA